MSIISSPCKHLKNSDDTNPETFCESYIAVPDRPDEVGFCKRPYNYRCVHAAASMHHHLPLSHSSVQDYLACHRRYYLRAIRGIQVQPRYVASPLKMGTLWDRVLQKLYGAPISIPQTIADYDISPLEVAKVRGVYRAYKSLGVQVDTDFDPQATVDTELVLPFSWKQDSPVTLHINGFYDRKYANYFVENKFSSRPENYEDIFFIASQVGTYFMADPNLEYCTMEIVRTPSLRQASKGKSEEETPEHYEQRVFEDVMSRPAHYFIGWDEASRRYGRTYHRSEFNLEELRSRYLAIFREIYAARCFGGFYKSERCKNLFPGIPCDYLPICRYNNVAENIFDVRGKPRFLFPEPCDFARTDASNNAPAKEEPKPEIKQPTYEQGSLF